MKKIIALALSALLLIGAAVVGTVAFLTDTDQAVNVMTSGNIEIEQYEKQRDKNGDLVDFKNSDMFPAFTLTPNLDWNSTEATQTFAVNGQKYSFWNPEVVKNVKDNIVYVKNTGKNAAYVRTFFAFENPFEDKFAEKVVLNWSSAVTAKALGDETIDNATYAIYVVTYEKAIAPGTFSAPSLLQFAFAETADNADMKAIDGSLEVLAFTQAVQTEGFGNDAGAALDRAFPGAHPWTGINAPGVFVDSYEGLAEASKTSVENIYIVGDITLKDSLALAENATLEIPKGVSATLDLNGKTFEGLSIDSQGKLDIVGGVIAVGSSTDYGARFTENSVATLNDVEVNSAGGGIGVTGGSQVSFNSGSVDVSSTSTSGRYNFYVVGEGSVLTINDGNFSFNNTMNQKRAYIYVGEGATVYVTGGTFGAASTRSDYSAGIKGDGTVVITGGTFGFDPTRWVAKGYEITKDDINGTWTVSPYVASDIGGLRENLNSGNNVIFSDDVTGDAVKGGYSVAGAVVNGNVLDGNGNTLTVNNANGTWDCAVHTTGGTIKNLTVSGAFRGILTGGIETDLYIENVVFDGVVYTFQADGETGACADYGVYISNSTLNGWTSFSNMFKEVIFTNCSFGEGRGYAFCRPYNASVFENCVFEEGFEFDTSKTSDITFINCYYGETLITAENAASLGLFYNGLNGITIK